MNLRKLLSRIWSRLVSLWARFKKLVYSILLALGLVAAPILYAGVLPLEWTNAVERIDGTTFDPATEQAEIRIYCNGVPTPMFVSTGAATSLTEIVPAGNYTCYATTVDTDGQESFPSNEITKTVTKALPNPPVLTEETP